MEKKCEDTVERFRFDPVSKNCLKYKACKGDDGINFATWLDCNRECGVGMPIYYDLQPEELFSANEYSFKYIAMQRDDYENLSSLL